MSFVYVTTCIYIDRKSTLTSNKELTNLKADNITTFLVNLLQKLRNNESVIDIACARAYCMWRTIADGKWIQIRLIFICNNVPLERKFKTKSSKREFFNLFMKPRRDWVSPEKKFEIESNGVICFTFSSHVNFIFSLPN